MRKVFLWVFIVGCFFLAGNHFAQGACTPIGAEVADNNIDEDCDGWLATSWGYKLRAGHPRGLVTQDELSTAIDRMYGENAREPYSSWFHRIKDREDTTSDPSMMSLVLIYKATEEVVYLEKYRQALSDYLMSRTPGEGSGPSKECLCSMDIMWDEISDELKLKALELSSPKDAFCYNSGINAEEQNFYAHGIPGRDEAILFAGIYAFDPILNSDEVRNNPDTYSFNCPLFIKTIKEEMYPGGQFWDTERRIAGDMTYSTALPGSYGGVYDNFGYDRAEEGRSIYLTATFSNLTGEDRVHGELHDQYRGFFWQNMSVPHTFSKTNGGSFLRCARIWNTGSVDSATPQRDSLALLAHWYKDGHIQKYANIWKEEINSHSYDYYTKEIWWMLLFYEDSLEETDFDENPTSVYFSGPGIVTMRSDWSKDAAFAVFLCGESMGRRYEDANSFIIHRKTDLMPRAGRRIQQGEDGKKHWWYHIRSISTNTLKVFDPEESFDVDSDGHRTELHEGQRLVSNENMGGQLFETGPSTTEGQYGATLSGRPGCVDCQPNRELYNTGDILKYEHKSGEYTYAVGDGEPGYTKKIDYYIREFVYLRPNTFVIFDKVKSVNPNYKKVWVVHTVNEPVIQGQPNEQNNGMKAYNNTRDAVMDSGVNMTYYHFLLPTQNKVVVRGGETVLVSSPISPSNPITEDEIIKQPDIARWVEVFAIGQDPKGTITIHGDAEEGDNVTEDIVLDGDREIYKTFYPISDVELTSTYLKDTSCRWQTDQWKGYNLWLRDSGVVLITGNNENTLFFNETDVFGVWSASIFRYYANSHYHWKRITGVTTDNLDVDNLILSTEHYFDAVDSNGKLYSFAPHTDGTEEGYKKRKDYGQWTLEVEASDPQLHDNFLNVIHLADPGDGDATTNLIEGDDIAGVLIDGSRVVVFAKQTDDLEDVEYSINATGDIKNMVVDLVPSTEYDLYVNGSSEGTVNSSSEGVAYFTVRANGSANINLSSTGNSTSQAEDVNQDGSVNVSDVQLVVNVILGNATNSRADVNGDGTTDVSDVQAVVNGIVD